MRFNRKTHVLNVVSDSIIIIKLLRKILSSTGLCTVQGEGHPGARNKIFVAGRYEGKNVVF